METRKERFKRLASKRTNNIIKDIRILSNCSNKSAYDYTSSDIDKIFKVITDELKIAKSKFSMDSKNKKFEL